MIKQNKIILKLRKLTKFSILLCKEALTINKWDIKKSIEYLRNKFKSKLKNNNYKINNGIVISKINNEKNIGVIIKINVNSDYIINNIYFKNFIKKIIKISFKSNINNIKDLLNNSIVNNEILDKNIMFKEKIIISNFYKINCDYINNYNHHNYKFSSIVGFKINYKIISNLNYKFIYYISKNISIYIIINNLIINNKKYLIKLNKYLFSKDFFINNKKIFYKFKYNHKKFLYIFKNNIKIKYFKYYLVS
ncbi:hypothetical protein [Candidatus Shikimatogenerans bostrichidophilus]|uniref:hypothetical protein n=1 Tax=Candidatus Shikimatogenerans bostrichidophilus TaxID=2943807 RepID=UPI0029662B4D